MIAVGFTGMHRGMTPAQRRAVAIDYAKKTKPLTIVLPSGQHYKEKTDDR